MRIEIVFVRGVPGHRVYVKYSQHSRMMALLFKSLKHLRHIIISNGQKQAHVSNIHYSKKHMTKIHVSQLLAHGQNTRISVPSTWPNYTYLSN